MSRTRILVWDLPTRAFHWLLAISFAGAFLTAESERYGGAHVMFGYTVLGLVAFRLVWGLVGTRHARFWSFAYGPRRVLTYVKSLLTRSPQHYLGHNPAAGWAIFALLALSALAGATGYATYNGIGGHWMGEVHEAVANTLLGMVVVHIAGVFASSVLHRENLVRSMLSGYKYGASGAIRTRHRVIGAALAAAVAFFWIGGMEGTQSPWAPTLRAPATEHHAAGHKDD